MVVDERVSVYRFFNKEGELLYVGMSRDPDKRERAHSRNAADTWYPKAVRRNIVWYNDRIAAEKAEMEAITNESPLFNIQGNFYGSYDWQRRFDQRKIRMKALMRGSTQPLYRLTADLFRVDIETGRLPGGTKLEKPEVYGEPLGISGVTVKAGLDLLVEEVLLRSVGSGYYVQHGKVKLTATVPLQQPVQTAAILRERMSAEDLQILAGLLAA